MYYELDGQLSEIKRQLRQPTGYPFDVEGLKAALQSIIEGRFETGNTDVFSIWHPLTIGGVPADKLLEQLENAGCEVSSWVKDIMGKSQFTTLPKPTHIQLAKAKVKDLGFKEEPTTTELFTRIKEVGDLCPAKVGPHLRLAGQDQPKGTIYWVAMKPITGSDGYPFVFSVRRFVDGRRWLDTYCASPDARWSLELEIVFCLSKPV